MTQVAIFERFQDAVDRRSSQVVGSRFDYKAGFYENFLQGLVESNPSLAAQVQVATKLLEEWADEHEIRDRKYAQIEG